MSRNVDLLTLRTRLRQRTDTEGEVSRFPDTEANDCINEGIAQFHVEMLRLRGQGFAEASTSVTTILGQEMYALPAALLEVIKVWATIDGQENVLRTYEPFETDGLIDTVSWGPYVDICYRMVGDNISLRPLPPAGKVVKINYVATAVKLVTDGNTVDGVDGLEEFVVAWAGARFAIKQRDWELKQALDAELSYMLARIQAIAAARNAAEPPRMQDVRGQLSWRRGGRRWLP